MTYGWAERDEFHNYLELKMAAFYGRRPQLRNAAEEAGKWRAWGKYLKTLPPHVDIEPGEIKDEETPF